MLVLDCDLGIQMALRTKIETLQSGAIAALIPSSDDLELTRIANTRLGLARGKGSPLGEDLVPALLLSAEIFARQGGVALRSRLLVATRT
jgi:hypothetical protein